LEIVERVSLLQDVSSPAGVSPLKNCFFVFG
jgi:hypothetical protein